MPTVLLASFSFSYCVRRSVEADGRTVVFDAQPILMLSSTETINYLRKCNLKFLAELSEGINLIQGTSRRANTSYPSYQRVGDVSISTCC
jgi:hypothetical protein